MKFLRYLMYFLLLILVVFLVVAFIQPKQITVQRERVIDAPVEVVFEHMNDLKKWEKWSYWHNMDPDWKVEYSIPSSGKGAYYKWESEDPNVGAGVCTIIESIPNEKVACELDFRDWEDGVSHSKVERMGDKTKATMYMTLDAGMNPINRVVNSFLVAPMLKPSYDTSLSNLDAYLQDLPPAIIEVESDSTIVDPN